MKKYLLIIFTELPQIKLPDLSSRLNSINRVDLLKPDDVKAFWEAIEATGENNLPASPKRLLDLRAKEHPVTLQEFQDCHPIQAQKNVWLLISLLCSQSESGDDI